MNIEFDQRAWSVELTFWRPLKLTDEEMGLFFAQYDGKWSEQTKRALGTHKARGLELNKNWALTGQDWACPACRRRKTEIFRVSPSGVLLAKLEEHHDHLRDLVYRRARELFGNEWLRTAPRGTPHAMDALRELVTRFSNEMVCSDCNSADAEAKTRLGGRIHECFSFSPLDIADFVAVQPNAPHRVDLEKAEVAWNQLRPAFGARLKLINDLLPLVQAGVLAYQRGSPWFQVAQHQFGPGAHLHRAFLRETRRDERQTELSRALDEFLARSVQRDRAFAAPMRTAALGSVPVPSQAAYAAYNDPVSPRLWRGTPEDWQCPVCERHKREVLRKSKAGKWSGGVREHIQHIAENDPTALWARRRLLPGFRNVIVIRDSETVLICSDCREVESELKRRRRDIPEPFLSVDDLRDCLTAIAAHVAHQVDWDEAADRAMSNAAVSSAWDAYQRHSTMAAEFRQQYRRKMEEFGDSRKKAIRELSERVMFEAEIDDQEEAMELTEWLLEDAERRASRG